MGFAKTWTEEIVAEWFSLTGYQVTTGLPVGSGVNRVSGRTVGGRMEADIVAARLVGSTLEIQHVEVGALADNIDNNIKRIEEKFSPKRQQEVRAFLQQSFGSGLSSDYNCRYIGVYISRKQLPELHTRLSGIRFQTFDDFILQDALPTLKPYVQQMKTVPDGLWLLGMLSYLHTKKMLVETRE